MKACKIAGWHFGFRRTERSDPNAISPNDLGIGSVMLNGKEFAAGRARIKFSKMCALSQVLQGMVKICGITLPDDHGVRAWIQCVMRNELDGKSVDKAAREWKLVMKENTTPVERN
ncbi:hypothetical protein OAG52_00720 [Verrucomicrobia bacterium]|jgi:hypothetical protein|nr:hypothetical protein [Verrucomicrobiota bacterium]